MNYKFNVTSEFVKEFKVLAKKNKQLISDFDRFLFTFNHEQGIIIPGTSGAYKIRMSATGKGKRGSYRIIYYFLFENKIFFLKIYSKSIKENISQVEMKAIKQLIQKLKEKNKP